MKQHVNNNLSKIEDTDERLKYLQPTLPKDSQWSYHWILLQASVTSNIKFDDLEVKQLCFSNINYKDQVKLYYFVIATAI